MAPSFFFYDLETSGFDARYSRVMQFAGQRTDLALKPIGQPVNVLIKLTPDVLPSPDAILVTGITPQQTLAGGLTEAAFLKLFYEQVVQPGTVFVGFNNVRFDDEFMRFLHWRNFYDAYEWHWDRGCSRWDILDVARMTRALRPAGINWPFAPDGKPSNRLELLTAVNKLGHDKAHDALSDVNATIAVAKLLKAKQPDLWDYLLQHRDKKSVSELVNKATPFVYTSGRYSSQYLHTTAAVLLAKHDQQAAALVYDLRFDPSQFVDLSVDELIERWRYTKDPEAPPRLPVKTIKYNRCPAVAPLGVMKDPATQQRLQLSLETVEQNFQIFKEHHTKFATKIAEAVARMDKERDQVQGALVDNQLSVDERLYDGFLNDADRLMVKKVPTTEPAELTKLAEGFKDQRLKNLLPLYKARNFPQSLDDQEQQAWQQFIAKKLLAGATDSPMAKYFNRLEELAAGQLNGEQQFLLQELRLYAESIVPS